MAPKVLNDQKQIYLDLGKRKMRYNENKQDEGIYNVSIVNDNQDTNMKNNGFINFVLQADIGFVNGYFNYHKNNTNEINYGNVELIYPENLGTQQIPYKRGYQLPIWKVKFEKLLMLIKFSMVYAYYYKCKNTIDKNNILKMAGEESDIQIDNEKEAQIKIIAFENFLNEILDNFIKSEIKNYIKRIEGNIINPENIDTNQIEQSLKLEQLQFQVKLNKNVFGKNLSEDLLPLIGRDKIEPPPQYYYNNENKQINKIFSTELINEETDLCYQLNDNLVNLLIKHQININQEDFRGNTPLDLAIPTWNKEIIKMIIKNGGFVLKTSNGIKNFVEKIRVMINTYNFREIFTNFQEHIKENIKQSTDTNYLLKTTNKILPFFLYLFIHQLTSYYKIKNNGKVEIPFYKMLLNGVSAEDELGLIDNKTEKAITELTEIKNKLANINNPPQSVSDRITKINNRLNELENNKNNFRIYLNNSVLGLTFDNYSLTNNLETITNGITENNNLIINPLTDKKLTSKLSGKINKEYQYTIGWIKFLEQNGIDNDESQIPRIVINKFMENIQNKTISENEIKKMKDSLGELKKMNEKVEEHIELEKEYGTFNWLETDKIDIIAHVLKSTLGIQFYRTLYAVVYEYVKDNVRAIKNNKKPIDIATEIINDNNEKLAKYLLGDFSKELTQIILQKYPDPDYRDLKNKSVDDLFNEIREILMENTIIEIETKSEIITKMEGDIFEVYKKYYQEFIEACYKTGTIYSKFQLMMEKIMDISITIMEKALEEKDNF
jgi:hypothetical protein